MWFERGEVGLNEAKEWLSVIDLGMLLVKRTRAGLHALCLEERRVKLLLLERQALHDV